MQGRRTRNALIALVVAAAVALGGVAIASGRSRHGSKRPNVVFILTDDLSWNLVNARFAPHIVDLERRGETFTRYFVADSLCCPSRSTIFTGLFPHDTKVVTNLPPAGGFAKFQSRHLARRTFAVALRRRGYMTAMLGKYLNGYGDPRMTAQTAPVPRGWSDWHVSNRTGYAEFNYFLNDNGTARFYPGAANYGVDVLNADARAFVARAGRRPFAVEVATFAPHAPYTPAPRNANDFPGLTEPRDPSFDANNVNPPAWLGARAPLSPSRIATIDASYRKRAQAVEAVDRLVADLEAQLAADHVADNTYIVFSSDNGYHLGQHGLDRGKQTAFDTDIRVPLIVAGPGVPHNRVVTRVTQNVDLYPTFVALAGAHASGPFDGHSLVALLHPPRTRPRWRTVALLEHRHQARNAADPDVEGSARSPTTYVGIRISAPRLPGFRGPVEGVYVEYQDAQHQTEYYDIRRDPFEIRNIAPRLTRAQRMELHAILTRLERCHTARACWAAGIPE